MKNLISKIQKELEVSKGNAIFRVIMMDIFIVTFVAITIITFISFPYHSSQPAVKLTLPHGNYEVVQNISEQGIQLDEKQYYSMLPSNETTFVCVKENGTSIFMFNKNGIPFYYKKNVVEYGSCFSLSYIISNVSIDNDVLIAEQKRFNTIMILLHIVIPIVLLFVLSISFVKTQTKDLGLVRNAKGEFRRMHCYVWI